MPTFGSNYSKVVDSEQDHETQQTLLAILEALCGLAQSARPDSVQEFFRWEPWVASQLVVPRLG